MSSRVLQTVPLGFQWPTVSPFLFCVHHLDHYPAANEAFGPDAPLAGRDIGQDFAGVDGWRMYHGEVVPGFPSHPHRGFETVTFVRQGIIDHSDSLGAAARYGRGDVQWMTAGAGIQHAEMFPLLDREQPNTVELFQIWMNLPAASKMVDPHFTMFWDQDIPRIELDGVRITVIAGALDGAAVLSPPPASWAADSDHDVAIWHVVLEPGAQWEMPAAAHADTIRTVYVFDGDGVTIDSEAVGPQTGVVVTADTSARVASDGHTELLVLQGRPIDEPVAQYGPFVMNTRDEIEQAFADYQRTQFGGWPWGRTDPVHGADPAHFARFPDGAESRPGTKVPG